MFYIVLYDGHFLPYQKEAECKSMMFFYKNAAICAFEDIGNGRVGREWRFNLSKTALHTVHRSFSKKKYYEIALRSVKKYEKDYEQGQGSESV